MIGSQPVINVMTCVLLASPGRKLPERKVVGEVTPDEQATVLRTLTSLAEEVAELSRRVDVLTTTTGGQLRPQVEQRDPPDS